MRTIERTTKFKRDYKREVKSDSKLNDQLLSVIEMLATDADLPERLRDHSLAGEWKGFRDCHVRPDLVLIYEKVGANVIVLARPGSHSELFG